VEQLPAVRSGVLEAIGGTPLVRLSRLLPAADFNLFGKLELLNPGGSIKDRPALAILNEGLRLGAIGSQTVIIESSSGNMGIGLAQACRYHGLRFICVVDPKTTTQNLKVLRAYGAQIDCVAQPDPVSGEFLQARLARVKTLLSEIEDSFWPNQYANEQNPASHYRTTMHEIATALAGRVDLLFVATSTCGTMHGCGEYIRDFGLGTKMIAVDAVGSLIFSDQRGPRLIPGLGAGFRPPLCALSLIDECMHVSDLDCIVGCRQLIDREAILAGGSSGGVLTAVEHSQGRIPPDSNCVVVLADRGERYLDTIFDDEWVHQHFGQIDHLWQSESSSSKRAALPLSAPTSGEAGRDPAGSLSVGQDLQRDSPVR
jgi:2,3-diaminopropionate biosynthesis protein SbnA